jgi:ribosomal protein L16 Arg81 hydroxylase
MAAAEFNFERLIAPYTTDQFFLEYWEAKPLSIRRKQSDYYATLLSGSDIDYILSTSFVLDRSHVELIGSIDNPELLGKEYVSAAYQAYRQGASFRIRGINRHWKALWLLCRDIQELFAFPTGANLYCTPKNSHGLDRHYDHHDTVVLQIAGSKHWAIYSSPEELPLENVPLLGFEKLGEATQYRGAPVVGDVVAQTVGEQPVEEFVMEPGDLLYLPRGFVHEARTSDDISVHVTIGIHALTWLDLIAVSLGQFGHKDVRLRKALPVGFNKRTADASIKKDFAALLETLAQNADVSAALEEIGGSFIWNQQAIAEGSIIETETTALTADTTVERRPGLLSRLVVDGDFVRIVAAHADVSLPRDFEPAMRFVSENKSFRIGAIPGRLTDHSRINLVHRLIRNGFLRVAQS